MTAPGQKNQALASHREAALAKARAARAKRGATILFEADGISLTRDAEKMNWIVKGEGPVAYCDTLEYALQQVANREMEQELLNGSTRNDLAALLREVRDGLRSSLSWTAEIRDAIRAALLAEKGQ